MEHYEHLIYHLHWCLKKIISNLSLMLTIFKVEFSSCRVSRCQGMQGLRCGLCQVDKEISLKHGNTVYRNKEKLLILINLPLYIKLYLKKILNKQTIYALILQIHLNFTHSSLLLEWVKIINMNKMIKTHKIMTKIIMKMMLILMEALNSVEDKQLDKDQLSKRSTSTGLKMIIY